MGWITRTLTSSIGKKVIVALTGLGLLGFLFGHLYGNLHLFWGADDLDHYAHHLHEYWFLPLMEIGILLLFVVHIGLVIQLTVENRRAGGGGYAVSRSKYGGGPRSLASKIMPVSGLIVLSFLVVHIIDYRARLGDFEGKAPGEAGGLGATVVETLTEPWRAALYILGCLFIGFHLYHGIQSAARSLGVSHPKWSPILEKTGLAISTILALAFAAIPVAILAGVIS